MKQLTYILGKDIEPEEMGAVVAADRAYQNARSRLQIVFEPVCDRDHIQHRLNKAHALLPDCTVVGITTLGPITRSVRVPSYPVCTFLLFEEADVHVDVFDCHDADMHDVAHEFLQRLGAYEHAKGVLCSSSYVKLDLQPFVDEVVVRRPDIPFFGAQAGTSSLANDESVFFVDDHVYDRGILAITFCGENLHIETGYNLGWRPIGNDHVITDCEPNGLVHTIDDKPAAAVYQHYLNVRLDEYFFENVCSFPLVVRNGSHLIAHVPMRFTEDGSLVFPTALERGSHAYFSYAHPDHLLHESRASAKDMEQFQPEALLLFACVNRRVFLGNDRADREFSYYRRICESYAWAYGYGEILHTPEGGGILNSTIVAVGMREGQARTDRPASVLADEAEVHSVIPLSERLATFLEATTAELNDTIVELEALAKRDSLTGAVNRRRIDELLHYELSQWQPDDKLVLLMYDIDFFKQVNDTYGHDTGDVVLKDLTRCVQACLGADDTLGRWGGEEFLCLLTGRDMGQAQELAEQVRDRVEETSFLRVGNITISIGLTEVRPGDSPGSFFQRVDRALYDAKHAGRNCVRVR